MHEGDVEKAAADATKAPSAALGTRVGWPLPEDSRMPEDVPGAGCSGRRCAAVAASSKRRRCVEGIVFVERRRAVIVGVAGDGGALGGESAVMSAAPTSMGSSCNGGSGWRLVGTSRDESTPARGAVMGGSVHSSRRWATRSSPSTDCPASSITTSATPSKSQKKLACSASSEDEKLPSTGVSRCDKVARK